MSTTIPVPQDLNALIYKDYITQHRQRVLTQGESDQLYNRLMEGMNRRDGRVWMDRVEIMACEQRSRGPFLTDKGKSNNMPELQKRTEDIISLKQKKIRELREMKTRMKEEEVKKECTFTPKINKYVPPRKSSISPHVCDGRRASWAGGVEDRMNRSQKINIKKEIDKEDNDITVMNKEVSKSTTRCVPRLDLKNLQNPLVINTENATIKMQKKQVTVVEKPVLQEKKPQMIKKPVEQPDINRTIISVAQLCENLKDSKPRAKTPQQKSLQKPTQPTPSPPPPSFHQPSNPPTPKTNKENVPSDIPEEIINYKRRPGYGCLDFDNGTVYFTQGDVEEVLHWARGK